MKSVLSKIAISFVAILVIMISGCGGNLKNNNHSEGLNSLDMESVGKFVPDTKVLSRADKYKSSLLPVYVNFEGKLCKKFSYFAVKSPSGEFVQFDNEGDYSEFCTIIQMACEIAVNDVLYMISDEGIKQYGEILDGIVDYLYGEKKNILNKKIFTMIDKCYYNHHTKDWYFQLHDSRYGQKRYISNEGSGELYWGVCAFAAPSDKFYMTLDQPVPEGSLILCGEMAMAR